MAKVCTLTGVLAGCVLGMAVGWLTSPLVVLTGSGRSPTPRPPGTGGRGAACGGTRGIDTPPAAAVGTICIGLAAGAGGRRAPCIGTAGMGAPVASSRGGLVRSLAVRPPCTGAGIGRMAGCGAPGCCGAEVGIPIVPR